MFGDSAWLSLLWFFLCVIVIVGLAYWFTRFVAGHSGSGALGAARGAARMKVLARLTVGKDQSLLLVQMGERYLLVGAAPGGLSILTELTPEEADAWAQSPPAAGQTMSFKKALETVINQRKQR